MRNQHRKIQRLTIPGTLLWLCFTTTPVYALEILVFGDSWAKPIGNSLRVILEQQGLPRSSLHTTPRLGQACLMAEPDGLDAITYQMGRFPGTDTVHLSTGANDILNNWNPEMAGTPAEAELLQQIVDCVGVVVDHLYSIAPGVRVVWSSYDFLRPTFYGTPPELNAIFIKLAGASEEFANMRGNQVSFIDIIGTMQVTFGFDGARHSPYDPGQPIPPGHPSLPDESLPSPAEAFPPQDPTHPYRKGYDAMAQAQYDNFYHALIDDQVFVINPGLNDAWYDPETPGQGFLTSVFPESGQMFVAWFTFDIERPPQDTPAQLGDSGHRWLTAQGPYSGNVANLDIFLTEGGIFDSADPPASTKPEGYGSLTIEFTDCETGRINYIIDSPGVSGQIPIKRIVKDNVALCEALSVNP
jgi:hypothetical protein